jgi:hypothetical protein
MAVFAFFVGICPLCLDFWHILDAIDTPTAYKGLTMPQIEIANAQRAAQHLDAVITHPSPHTKTR